MHFTIFPFLFSVFERLTAERLDLKMKSAEVSAYEILADEFSHSHLKEAMSLLLGVKMVLLCQSESAFRRDIFGVYYSKMDFSFEQTETCQKL